MEKEAIKLTFLLATIAGLKHRATYILSYLTGHADVHWDWPIRERDK
jgi:hypothetical protein